MKAPSEQTVKRLFALSGNRCAFHECQTPIVEPSGTVTGEICHIKAKRPGPRYDPKQTDEQRHAFANLILLCRRHHKIVDAEPGTYTVELLTEIKEMHERNGSIEVTQEDARLARRLLDSYLQIVATEEAQVIVDSPGASQQRNVTVNQNTIGNNNTVVAGDQHVYHRPPKIEHILERAGGEISTAQGRQVHEWIDNLVENTVGMTRDDAYKMWWSRFKKFFGINKYEQLLESRLGNAEDWYRKQKAILTRRLKTKAPDAWRNARYGAIKQCMKKLGVENETYYPGLSVRLKMKKPFTSLTKLTKRDLDRVYSIALRDLREKLG